jgi:hypothetical protein
MALEQNYFIYPKVIFITFKPRSFGWELSNILNFALNIHELLIDLILQFKTTRNSVV